MGLRSTLISLYHYLPPAIRNFRSNYRNVHDFYSYAQWWSKKEIETWQLMRLQDIVQYAYKYTRGYRSLYDEAGITPNDIQSLSDIKCLPITDKNLLRDNIKDFTVDQSIAGRLSRYTTGGSSGLPFEFYADYKNSGAEAAFIDSAWESFGWKSSDIGIRLRGNMLGDKDNIIKKAGFKKYLLSSFYLTEENYEQYIKAIKSTRASYLHVYPSTITDLAHLILSHNDEGRLNIKHILLASENLYSWQEDMIKAAFPSSRLVSFYGHTERAIMAPWCEKEEKYHINPFYGYTEVLNDKNIEVSEGEIGELVGTSFWMYGTPFIRYKTNDFAEKGPSYCEQCGRNFPVLNKIDGRLSEVIIGRTGRRLSLTVFAGSVMHGETFDHIKQFRFFQKEKGVVSLLIIPDHRFNNQDMHRLEGALKKFLSDDFEFTICLVDKLERTPRGKFSYLEQHLCVDRSDNA